MATQPSFSTLLESAQSGDRTAIQQLLYVHYDYVHRHIARQIGRNDSLGVDTEDLLQEVFVYAIRDLQQCQAENEAMFRGWLRSITQNRIRDNIKHRRRKKRNGKIVAASNEETGSRLNLVELLPGDQETPSVRVATGEATRTLDVWLATLPDQQRDAVRLRYMERLSLQEIAEKMNKTEASVRGLLHRAKQRLRELMGRSSLWFSRK
ncbi:MAG: RNA polymerase sigma factor [Pirellulaceae bacterium]